MKGGSAGGLGKTGGVGVGVQGVGGRIVVVPGEGTSGGVVLVWK